MDNNKDQSISQLPLVSKLTGDETVPFAKDKGNGSFLVSLLVAYIRDGMATSQSVTDLNNHITQNFATKEEIPDISSLPTAGQYNQLMTAVNNLTTLVQNLKTRIDAFPAIPLNDNKHYAILNGQWESIAEPGHVPATIVSETESTE